MRVGLVTNWARSNSCTKSSHLLFEQAWKSIFTSPIIIISRPVVCATDSSSSSKSIHPEVAVGGRYKVQIKYGLEFVILRCRNSSSNINDLTVGHNNEAISTILINTRVIGQQAQSYNIGINT